MMDLILKFLPFISFVLSAVFGLVLYTMRNAFISKQAFQENKEVQERVNAKNDKRISAVETAIKSQPTSEDIHELAMSNVRLEEQIKSLTKWMETFARQMALIDEYLKKGDK